MADNLTSLYESPPALDEHIVVLQSEIQKQESTLASLTGDGHETADAKRRLVNLLTTLNALLQMKIKAR
jgi:hypothetical protein